MLHERLESMLRKRANSMRLEAEKRRAQKDRADDVRLIKNADKALGDLARKRLKADAGKLMDAVTRGDQSAVWRFERFMLQREAQARGLLKQESDGKWVYEKGKADRNNRPAEKLVKNKAKGKKVERGRSI